MPPSKSEYYKVVPRKIRKTIKKCKEKIREILR